jgi:acetyltransferase-like isoleucine patch superfamily enzyme
MQIADPANIDFHPDDLNNFQMGGTYFANPEGRVVIGRGTLIGPNVGLITVNHDPEDVSRNLPGRDIVLGDGCWIGMNAVILPGVTLGPRTVVGAGAVVTRSFPAGACVIAGVPARFVRKVGPD